MSTPRQGEVLLHLLKISSFIKRVLTMFAILVDLISCSYEKVNFLKTDTRSEFSLNPVPGKQDAVDFGLWKD